MRKKFENPPFNGGTLHNPERHLVLKIFYTASLQWRRVFKPLACYVAALLTISTLTEVTGGKRKDDKKQNSTVCLETSLNYRKRLR